MPYKNLEAKQEYQRQWIAKRRAEFFEGKVCVTCGSKDRLELDHIDRTTKVASSIWSWSQERRNEEIAKCQVLCHGCHLDKTKIQMDRGTATSYAKLTESSVLEILSLSDMSTKELGLRFNVDPGTIRHIRRGTSWKHVQR